MLGRMVGYVWCLGEGQAMSGAWEEGVLCPVLGRRVGYVQCLGGGWAMSGAWEEGRLCPVLATSGALNGCSSNHRT